MTGLRPLDRSATTTRDVEPDDDLPFNGVDRVPREVVTGMRWHCFTGNCEAANPRTKPGADCLAGCASCTVAYLAECPVDEWAPADLERVSAGDLSAR